MPSVETLPDFPVSLLTMTSVPYVPDMQGVFAALGPDRNDDVAFQHAPSHLTALTPATVRPDVDAFGEARDDPADKVTYRHQARAISSFVLNNAYCSGNSLSILDSQLRLFRPGFENLRDITKLAGYDPTYCVDGDGRLNVKRSAVEGAPTLNTIALPICSLGTPNYGHFLLDGLPAAFMLARLLPAGSFRVIGSALKPWQRDILRAVGLEGSHMSVPGLVRYRKILPTSMLSYHLNGPTAFARPLFDSIRFRFGSGGLAPTRKLFLSRRNHPRRGIVNVAEIEEVATRQGFEIVSPETLPFAEQVRLFGSARVVVGESGAAMVNIGFCAPGTSVLEIQTTAFGDNWIRATASVFAQHWHVFQGTDIPRGHPLFPPQEGVQFATHVDPAAFADALDRVVERGGPANGQ